MSVREAQSLLAGPKQMAYNNGSTVGELCGLMEEVGFTARTDGMRDQDGTSNEALMARFQARLDASAFERIVSRFLSPALAAAGQILSDAALAEDAVQETFLRLVRGREAYVATKPLASWFYAILRNVCTDMLRRRARQAHAALQ